MIDFVTNDWPIVAAAVLVALLIIWLLLRGDRGRVSRGRRPDVLDEGAAPARRNQALIDSPAAATIVPPVSVAPRADHAEAIGAAPPAPENAEALDWEGAERAEEIAALRDTPDAAVSAATAAPDDLRKIKGVGPKLVAALTALGVTRYDQIAGWSDADIDRVDRQLGTFAGRIRRDGWVEQARLLASGDLAGYEAKFGKV